MSDVNVTVVGHVGTNPTLSMSENGTEWSTFRMASTRRVRDPLTGQWSDGATLWFTVKTWRDKARNVAHSLRKGDPVVVTGRLMVDEWTSEREVGLPDGTTTTFPEQRYKLVVEAQHVGPDATRGIVRYAPVIDRGSPGRGADGAPGPRVEDPWSTSAEAGGVAGGDRSDVVEQDASADLDAEISGLLEEGRVDA
jgi:single-strand DNA-binding protein